VLAAMRITIDRCPERRFELAQARPAADLTGAVVRYAGYVERAAWALEQREVAAPVVPLIINLGAPFRVRLGSARDGGDAHGSFVAGLYGGYADVAALGPAHCLQVDLTPLGARRLFALPMQEIACRTVDLRLVAGRGSDELAERLYCIAGWRGRFALLDAFVRRRLAAAPLPSPAVAWAWQQRVASDGRLRIGELARSAGAASSRRCASRARSACLPRRSRASCASPGRAGRSSAARATGRAGARLRLRRSGPSDPRVPRARRRHAAGLCQARSSTGNKSSRRCLSARAS
jgi:hypothetical protein